MLEFLRAALAALPEAAKSNRAAALYIVTALCWLVIALRVTRNRNLLTSLEKLPARDRLRALETEMNGVPLKEGVSAEQFLRARIHRYYFWGFVALCILISVLFFIASNSSARLPPPDQPTQMWEEKLSHLDTGLQKDYVTQLLGLPIKRTATPHFERMLWKNEFFALIVEFTREGDVDGYVLTSYDLNFHPLIPFDHRETQGQLGRETFDALDTFNDKGVAPKDQLKDPKNTIPGGLSARYPVYTEAVSGNGSEAMGEQFDYISISSAGVNYNSSPSFPSILFDLELDAELRSGHFGKAVEEVRHTMVPNSMAVHKTPIDKDRYDDTEKCKVDERCKWSSVWAIDPWDPIVR